MKSWLIGKDPDAGKDWGQQEKAMTEDEMDSQDGWHHWLHRHEYEQNPGDSEGQGSLVCCSPWESQRVRHDLVTEQQTGLPASTLVPTSAQSQNDIKGNQLMSFSPAPNPSMTSSILVYKTQSSIHLWSVLPLYLECFAPDQLLYLS